MSYTEFSNISQFLTLSTRPHSENFQKVEILENFLVPGIERGLEIREYLCIDESIIPFRGRHKLKQYNPMKPNKWGFKVFLLCDSASGYVFRYKFYAGGEEFCPNKIVKTLLEGLGNRNIKVTMDNCYMSIALVDYLDQQGIKTTGTMKKNPVGLPPNLKTLTNSMAKGDTIF